MPDDLYHWRQRFIADIADPLFVETMFDHMPDVVFSVKDRLGRYVAMSDACVERCGLNHKREAIGKTASDLFPAVMAERYIMQDRKVFVTGKPLIDNLDLTLYNSGLPGWCLTTKLPLHNRNQELIGLACISKDLIEPSRAGFIDEKFAAMIDYILDHHDKPLLLDELAIRSSLSVAQLDRRMKKIFHISTGQFIIKTRIDAAAEQLRNTTLTIAAIALDCGFCDQSALTRQFRQLIGLSPGEYRKWASPARNH